MVFGAMIGFNTEGGEIFRVGEQSRDFGNRGLYLLPRPISTLVSESHDRVIGNIYPETYRRAGYRYNAWGQYLTEKG